MAINKIRLIFAIILIAIIVIGYFLYDYYQKQKRVNEINEYKKRFYEGMLCEYSCPMASQEYKNKTQMLPEINCVKACVEPFKEKYSDKSFKKEELEKDSLLKDIDDAIKKCKTGSVNMNNLSLDNSAYFNCSAKGLEGLREKYSYLSG